MTCAACGSPFVWDYGPSLPVENGHLPWPIDGRRPPPEHAICCAAPVCYPCWEADRTCADVAACQTRQAAGVFDEIHDCKPPDS